MPDNHVKPWWREWVSAAVAVVAMIAAMWSAVSAHRATDLAERQTRAAEEMVRENPAPDIDAVAFYLRTPVPDPSPFLGFPTIGDTAFPMAVDRRYAASSGVWHVTVQNNGDAVAVNVRVRAPGAFYARFRRSGGNFDYTLLQAETLAGGELAPGETFSALLWLEPDRILQDLCVPPIAPDGCFTGSDLVVFADNATGDVRFVPFEFPTAVAPFDTTTAVDDTGFGWNPWTVTGLLAALLFVALVVGMQVERRRRSNSDDVVSDSQSS